MNKKVHLKILLALSFTFFLTTAVFLGVIFHKNVYNKEFVKTGTYERIADADLLNEDILTYLAEPEKNALLYAEKFSEKEISHMKDVKQIIQILFGLFYASGLLLIFAIITLKISEENWIIDMLDSFYYGTMIEKVFFYVLALGLIFFGTFFFYFHKIFFSNMNWLLDSSSTLIRLYSQDFFFHIFTRMALIGAISGTILF